MRKINDPASEVCLPGFEQFQTEFLNTRREEMESLYAALKERDFVTLCKQTHKWRGFAAPYGFQELAILADALEAQALSENSQGCDDVLKNIADYLGSDD